MRTPPGRANGDRYVDELVADGAKRFADALGPDVRKVLAALERAKSFEELERLTTKLHARMSPKKAGAVLTKTMILAELGGRASVVEDLGE